MRDAIADQVIAFRIHAKTRGFLRRVEELHDVLASLDPRRCYVSWSSGKDSGVVAHAAHAVHPGIAICKVDAGVPVHWSEAERRTWIEYASRQGWDLHLFTWEKYQEKKIALAEHDEAHRRAAHESMFAPLSAWAQETGRDHILMGIRAEESRGRRASLATHGERYRALNGMTRVAPLGRWTTMDVWAYTVTKSLPYLDIYRHLGPEARNGLIGRSGCNHGRMVYLRRFYPEAYRHARDVLDLEYAR